MSSIDDNKQTASTNQFTNPRTYARARKLTTLVMILGLACTMCAVFPWAHNTIPVWICLSMPWAGLAVVVASRGRFSLSIDAAKAAKPNVLFLFVMPVFALAARVSQDLMFIDGQRAAAMGAVLGVVLVLLTALVGKWRARDLRKSWLLPLFIFMYGVFGAMLTNCLFDHRAPTVYPVKVLATHRGTGRAGKTYLTVSAWGQATTASNIVVSNALYNEKRPGDVACIRLYPGAYQVSWYTLGDCDEGEEGR